MVLPCYTINHAWYATKKPPQAGEKGGGTPSELMEPSPLGNSAAAASAASKSGTVPPAGGKGGGRPSEAPTPGPAEAKLAAPPPNATTVPPTGENGLVIVLVAEDGVPTDCLFFLQGVTRQSGSTTSSRCKQYFHCDDSINHSDHH